MPEHRKILKREQGKSPADPMIVTILNSDLSRENGGTFTLSQDANLHRYDIADVHPSQRKKRKYE